MSRVSTRFNPRCTKPICGIASITCSSSTTKYSNAKARATQGAAGRKESRSPCPCYSPPFADASPWAARTLASNAAITFAALSSGRFAALGLNLRALGFPINRRLYVCRLGSFGLGLLHLRLKSSHDLGSLIGVEVRALGLDLRALGLPINSRCGLDALARRSFGFRGGLLSGLCSLWRPLRRPISRPFHARPSERGK